MEMLNRSIRRPVDISAGLGIQPFATVPYIKTGSETRWKRGAVVAALVVALGVIPLALLLVHTYYMPLDLLFASWGEASELKKNKRIHPQATMVVDDKGLGLRVGSGQSGRRDCIVHRRQGHREIFHARSHERPGLGRYT